MAAGAHSLSLTTPALAEQARQKEASAEHAVVPHAPAAASDGVPVPLLAGGVVLAFAVGLSGGVVHRRRRVARRTSLPVAAAPAPPAPSPVREVSEPPQPAPPPPEPETPAPRVVAPPPAPAPPPPEPPRVQPPARPPKPLRLVPRADVPRPAPAADAPLTEAPERPRPQPEAAATEPVMPPLTEAPEALRVPPSAEAPEPQLPPAGPARRFARVAHWPDEAAELWTCEIDWKAGYRKANFRAMVASPGEPKRRPLAESAPVRWALMGEPEPPTPELAVRVRALVEALEAAGWEHIGRGRQWYQQRFLWRAESAPQPVAVPDLIAGEGSD